MSSDARPVRAVGTDPKINDTALLGMLRDEAFPLTPNGVRSMLSLVMLGCYDRQVKRRFFAEMLDLSARIEMTVSDIESAMRMRALLVKTDPEKSPEVLDAEIAKIQETWKTQRHKLAEQWALVCECPTASDSIS